MSEENIWRESPTLWLVSINVGIYVLTSVVSGSLFFMDPRMMQLFGLSTYSIQSGRFYTIVTSIFFHSSIAHVGSNMLFLIIYGSNLEENGFEKQDIIVIYLTTGVASSLLSIPLIGGATTLGASGAVFGLLGAIAGYEWNQGDRNFKKVAFVGVINFILANGANTNVFAHLFGLLAGVVITKYPYLLKSEYAKLFRGELDPDVANELT